MNLARQLALLEGRVAAAELRPASANPYGPAQLWESVSWAHGWLVESLRSEGVWVATDIETKP